MEQFCSVPNGSGTLAGANVTDVSISCGFEPAVTTGAATAVVATTATLNGIVSANGSETAVKFEYGTSNAYGSPADATPSTLATDAADVAVSADLTGLPCNTSYHFQRFPPRIQAPQPSRHRRGATPKEGFGTGTGQGHPAAGRYLRGTACAIP